ncbi:1-aminocyclopropane-1-carboxylate deaminase [Phytohabitans suffuscus]|uniref:1-aminocyclopropane-1-carboxylate deaminase n=1 Tax=Phytohabitans suffuscus TaxID=624315 RepID=A0A6F8YJY9_9ACTN|nr:1-aminocyclopropane-1-carboxylate deaminase [Phytohabitans suffuscus]
MAPLRPFEPRVPSPVSELSDERLAPFGVRLHLKRDDLIHPEIPGNKWRKLEHNLAAARARGHRRLLTFGGAYSNHIRAVAAAGHYFGFSTVGVIRGEEHLPLNPTLAYASGRGMRLRYLDRTTYRSKTDPQVIAGLRREIGDFYLLPEGGSNTLALRGCAGLPAEIPFRFDHICCATGTGGTLAGIALGLAGGQRATGFSALKGGDFLADEVRRLQTGYGRVTGNWSVETGYHFGGYARRTAELDDFIQDFEERHKIALERTYVAKMLFGVFALVRTGRFAPGSVIVAVVTGA